MATKTARGAGSGLHVTAEQLTARDAVFVYDEFERHPSNIVAAYVFDGAAAAAGPVDPADVRAWMQARLGHSALFQRRLARVPGDADLPYWVPDTGFDIDEHVTTEGARSWPQVRGRISEIASVQLDLTRPPWELHVFTEVAGFPGAAAPVTIALLKFHHSVGDGMATRELELKLFAPDAAPAPIPVATGSWSAPIALLRAAAVAPYRLARFLSGLARTRAAAATVADRVAEGGLCEPIPLRPATRFNRRITPDLTFDLVTIPMAEVRAAKHACPDRTTLNDLMLAVVSGALADYLAECGETAPGALAAMVPISMRGIARWDSANQLCQMSVDLHTDQTDPLERLRAISRSARLEKQRWSDPAVIAREARVQTSPAWLLRLAGWARAQRVFDDVDTVPLMNTTISNVPPVAEHLEFLGAPMIAAFGVLPIMDGDGLRHLVVSQADRLLIAFSSDTAMLPDPAHYGELLIRSFRRLVAAVEAAR